MFYIIKELGPTTFQVTNNLKILATAILMRMFLGRHLTWVRWKALILLVLGSAVTQLRTGDCGDVKQSTLGFALVFLNSFASGAGGVVSEKLLKGGKWGCRGIHPLAKYATVFLRALIRFCIIDQDIHL